MCTRVSLPDVSRSGFWKWVLILQFHKLFSLFLTVNLHCIFISEAQHMGIFGSIKVELRVFSSVQSLSRVWLFATPWTTARQAPVHHQLLESTQTHVHWVSDAIQTAHPLLSLSPPQSFPAFRVFSNESALHIRWPRYWSFSFNISLSNEHPGLISFRMDWLDLLAVQGTLKRLLQHHSSKASILWLSL